MNHYTIGGWAQSLGAIPPQSFSYSMYGMVTNLTGLTTGTVSAPGWSPAKTTAPQVTGTVMWTYGGGLCSPNNMPASENDLQNIKEATASMNWAGVDFDDECDMNINNIIKVMTTLGQASYTFLAGWDYNNPNASPVGKGINDKVMAVAASGCCDRFNLMCYASAMWSQSDIIANVGPAIHRTISHLGQSNRKKVFLALTPVGLNDWNLDYFLNQVTNLGIGGLLIWNYPILKPADLHTIENRLHISSNACST